MRTVALLSSFVLACGAAPGDSNGTGRARLAFTSVEAALFDFDFDAKVTLDAAPPDAKPFIVAQLMYTVGQLNADRSVGRFERLEISRVSVQEKAGRFEVSYHAKLPVAWGGAGAPAPAYALVLPARVGESDQIAFAAKYGETCADPTGGAMSARRMFLFYRPAREGCVLDASDVVRVPASAVASPESTEGKSPEYHRIWEDRALRVAAMFSREQPTLQASDEGAYAFHQFVRRARDYLASLQSDASRRTESSPSDDVVQLGATLDDARRIVIDVRLTGAKLASDGASFDTWFDAVTPAADLVLYNGHADLGDNVRTLMNKGTFRARQYVIWAVNGCDTLAYVDRTLADRRAALNPDDPRGTRYMDQVSNVMAGYFGTGPTFAMRFLEAAVTARPTYRQILEALDPEQVAVVTGEEDNETPLAPAPPPAEPAEALASPRVPPEPRERLAAPPGHEAGCAQHGPGSPGRFGFVAFTLALVVCLVSRRGRRDGAPLPGSAG